MPTLSSITLSVGSKTMIQAKATKTDWRNSNIASKTITVYSGTVATPVISDAHDGTFTITCGTSGATIIYTTNNTAPSRTNGTEYTGAVTVDYGTTVRAFAYKQYYLDSAEATPVTTAEGWTPPIDNVVAWFDVTADTITTDASDNITEWADRVGSGFKFVKNGTKNNPAYDSVNKKVTFDGSNSESLICEDGILDGISNLTFVIIKKMIDNSSDETIFGMLNSSTQTLKLMKHNYNKLLTGLHCGAGLDPQYYTDKTEMCSDYKLLASNYVPGGTSYIYAYRCRSGGGTSYSEGSAGSYAMDDSNVALGSFYNGNEQYMYADVKAVILVNGTIARDSQAMTDLMTFCNTNYGADC